MQYAIVREGHSYVIVVEGEPLLRFDDLRRAARTIAELDHPTRIPETLRRRLTGKARIPAQVSVQVSVQVSDEHVTA